LADRPGKCASVSIACIHLVMKSAAD
jgi:hypothetical protein